MTTPKKKSTLSQEYIKAQVAKDMQPLYDAFNKEITTPKKKKLFVVDTITTFRNRYVVEADSVEHAYDEISMIDSGNDKDIFEPTSQRYLGEVIIDGRKISKKKFEKMLTALSIDKSENCSYWMGEKLIRKIVYDR